MSTASNTTMPVTVRYFAAAQAAAGAEIETVTVRTGATVRELVQELSRRSDEVARVLTRCSFLCDGIAVRDPGITLGPGQTIDVLPPYAGG